jgi:hypothetical protein
VSPIRWAALAALALLASTFSPAASAEGFRRGVRDALGERFEGRPEARRASRERPRRQRSETLDRLRRWNQIAIDASGLDHTPPGPGEDRVYGEQLGPTRASRALAIVQIAVFDAANAIAGGYQGYTGLRRAPADASVDAAIARAAHDTLVALFPSQAERLSALYLEDLAGLHVRRRDLASGLEVGRRAAAAILAKRTDDGAQHAEPRWDENYQASDAPGIWQKDPISQVPIALGAYWGGVRPFVLGSAAAFRVPPPPALDSPEFAAAAEEALALGGDGVVTPTSRSEEQTLIGIYWAYDGTPSLCAPPRLYNQIAVQLADQQGTGWLETARLLALVNVALADAGIAIWESKYYYQLWRPVTAFRVLDPTFTPLGAPASNLAGPNFTPPFPTYPSGHAGFGGALFQTLRRFFGTDQIAFTFVSDELDGETLDNQGEVRPLVPRHFESLSQAEEENGQSRIYLGIHWAFDKTEGIAQGRRVADAVFERAFRPLRRRR